MSAPTSARDRRLVVIGGGIAGLSAAWFAARQGGARVWLIEAADRLGGLIRSEPTPDGLIEHGPDAVVVDKPAALELARLLGLGNEIIHPPFGAPIQILHRDRITPLPEGFKMVVPTKIGPLLRSPLFSPAAKLRILCEPWVPEHGSDETVGAFIRRRCGAEVLQRVVQPMLASIFLTDAEDLSLELVMPRLAAMAARDGSLTRGFRRAAEQARAKGVCPARGFFSLRGGLEDMVTRLRDRLPAESILTGTRVQSLTRAGRGWRLELTGYPAMTADAVVLACPAYAAASMLSRSAPDVAAELAGMTYASCATLNLVYPRDRVNHPLDHNGFFVPAAEGRSFMACTFLSTKYADRFPANHAVLRVFVGGTGNPGAVDTDEGVLIDRIHRELEPILGLTAKPGRAYLHRHRQAMPCKNTSLKPRLARIAGTLPEGLFLAGGCEGTVGLPDSIRSGKMAAEAAGRFLIDQHHQLIATGG